MRFTTDNSDLARVRFLQQTAFHKQRSIFEIVQRSISPAKRTMVYIACMTSYTYNSKKVS